MDPFSLCFPDIESGEFVTPKARPARKKNAHAKKTLFQLRQAVLVQVSNGLMSLPAAIKKFPEAELNRTHYHQVKQLRDGLDPAKLKFGKGRRPLESK